jgi:hypothetical protein
MNPFRIAALILSAAIAACSFSTTAPSGLAPTLAPAASPVGAELVSPIPSETAPPEIAVTTAPFVPFTVTTWADNVVLRNNPGHLSGELGILPDNTPLTILSRTPGSEWLMVKTADGRVGWVFAKLVESSGPDLRSAPLLTPTGVLTVRGRLTDSGGSPVTGVQFAVVKAGIENGPRTDATTDADGVFYAFLPSDSTGSWWASYVAISCESNMMDSTCTNWTGEPDPKGTYVQLPGGSYSPMQFTWK